MAVAYAALIPFEGYKHRLAPQVRLTWNSHSGAPILGNSSTMSARSAKPTLYTTEPSLRLDKGVGFDTALPPFPRAKFAPERRARETDYITSNLPLDRI